MDRGSSAADSMRAWSLVALVLAMSCPLAAQESKKEPASEKEAALKMHFLASKRALDEDRLDDARRHIDLCLQSSPNNHAFHFLASRIHRLSSNFEKAEKHLTECERIGGKTATTKLEWQLMQAQGGDIDAVEKDLLKLLEQKHPESVSILETLSRCYMRELRLWTALRYLDQWAGKAPNSVRALHWCAWVRERTEGDRKGIYEDYYRVLKLVPDLLEFRLRLIALLVSDSRTEEALRHVEIVRKTRSDDPQLRLALAQCRALQGKTDEARALLDGLVKDGPDDCTVHYERGLVAAEPKERERWFRKSVQINPGMASAQFALCESLKQQGRMKEAALELKKYQSMRDDIENLKKLLRKMDRMPRDPDHLAGIGDILLRMKNEELGHQFMSRALAINPGHKKSHEILARFYERNNQPEKAARHRKMAADSKDGSPK